MDTKPLSVVVEYCPLCTMPFEYCEFSGMECKKGIKSEPQAEPTTAENSEAKPPVEEANPVKAETKGKKKTAEPKFNLLLHDKKGRDLTQLSGLQNLQINSKDLSKKLCKKFGCGSGSVTTDSIELQGIYKEPLIEFLIAEFKGLYTEQSFIIEDKAVKKKKGKKPVTETEEAK